MDFDEDYLEDLDIEADYEIHQLARPRRPNVLERYERRQNPLDLSFNEFYQRFQFTKNSVRDRLVPLLYPLGVRNHNRRGLPFNAVQVCIFLLIQ